MDINQAKKTINQVAREKIESLKGGGKDFQGALKRIVGIWNDPSHALIELLQNADDTGATIVKCKIQLHGIVFEHGGHPFNHNDNKSEIRAICSIDASTKDAEKHTGFMGIGFKAVFKLSDSPYIICPPWQFCFCPGVCSDGFDPGEWGWVLIPRWVDSVPSEVGEMSDGKTVFWLPYKEKLSKNAIKQIEREIFEKFDSLSLIFLRNIRHIIIEIYDGRIREICCDKKEMDIVIENKDRTEVEHRYKVFRKFFEIPPEVKDEYPIQNSGRDIAKVREIVLAFSLDLKGNLQPMTNSPLYTFLPTAYFPKLRFAVQGDFIPDTQRSNVDESLEWNRWLWRCVKNLLIDAIEGFTDDKGSLVEGFKNNEELRYQFYRVLPSEKDFPSTSDTSVIKDELIEPFWNYCRENLIVITSINANPWIKPSDAVWASLSKPSLSIQKLIDTEKLKKLKGRQFFVHPNVKGDEDRYFLEKMGVDKLKVEEIFEALKDEKWVNLKDLKWFNDLYVFLWYRLYENKLGWVNQKELELVKSLPIVRTFQGVKKPSEVLFPPSNEKEIELAKLAIVIPNVFFVDNSFLEGTSRKFLEKLVATFSVESIISRIILKGFEDGAWQNWTEEQYDKCIQFIRQWLKERKWELPTDLQRKIGAVRVRTEGNKLERADKCYFPKQELKLLYPDGNFIKLDDGDKEQRNFLLAMSVEDKPRVHIEEKIYRQDKWPDFVSHWNDYWQWLQLFNYRELNARDESIKSVATIDGWDNILLSYDHALILLSFIAKNWLNYYKKHTNSQYDCGHSTHSYKQVLSYLGWQLKTKLLPTTKGFMKPTKKIFVPLPEIKRVAGDLVPYISIPDGCKEREFIKHGQSLFEFLGLCSELDLEALEHLMEVVQKLPVNDNLKLYLSRIYHALGKRLEENESELGQINILVEGGEFKNPTTTSLYWNDDHDLGNHFQQAKGISFAWKPDNVERRYIDVFFQKARIKALSKHVQRKLVTSISGELNEELTSSIREKARYIYSLLKHHKADKASDNVDSAKKILSNIQVMSSDKIIEVFLSLDGVEKIVFVNAFYAIDSDIFYLTRDVEDFERSLELARVFGLDFGYISDIEVVFGKDNKKIEGRFQRQGITLLDWQPVKSPSAFAQKKGDGQDKNNLEPVEKKTTDGKTPIMSEWQPDCKPGEAKINVENFPIQNTNKEKKEEESEKKRNLKRKKDEDEDEKDNIQEILSPDAKKEIGRWGEEYALKCLKDEILKKKYQSSEVKDTEDGFTLSLNGQVVVIVQWLNKIKDKGIGFDIKLKENNDEEYIEVKSTKTDTKDWFDISKEQWELAQKKEDKFHIYRVYNAGSPTKAKLIDIPNPNKLWREGRLTYSTIRIKI